MMEHKFTDDEIVKALNCCGSENCRGCPYWDYKCQGGNQMIRNALDLINRQKAEIERLNKIRAELSKEIESFSDIGKMYSEIKAEAIKEFAERLKKGVRGCYYDFSNFDDTMDALMDIDNLVKEMTGEDSNE